MTVFSASGEDEVDDINDPVLPLEEAMGVIDQLAPLPEVEHEVTHNAVTLILEEGESPDFMLLRYLQIQERLEVKENIKQAVQKKFFDRQQKETVYDPLEVLTKNERIVMENTLKEYYENEINPLFVNILTPTEVKAITLTKHTSHEATLKDHPDGIIAYYFMGEPKKTKVYFGNKVFSNILHAKQKEIEEIALKESLAQTDNFGSIYQHINSLSSHLTQHYDELGLLQPKRDRLAAEQQAADTARANAHQANITAPANPENKLARFLPTILIAIIALLIIAILYVIIAMIQRITKNKQATQTLPKKELDSTLGFAVANDHRKGEALSEE